jgi:hypothetical protein
MDSPVPDASTLKRKRSPMEEGRDRPAVHSGNVTQINYLMKAKSDRLNLIEGDSESFGEILGMIDDYEGKSRDFACGELWSNHCQQESYNATSLLLPI